MARFQVWMHLRVPKIHMSVAKVHMIDFLVLFTRQIYQYSHCRVPSGQYSHSQINMLRAHFGGI